MLYVYYGDDAHTSRGKVRATIAKLLSKSPDALYFRITADDIALHDFEELTASQALFKSEYIVFLDMVFDAKDGEEIVLGNLEKIAQAPHPFFLLTSKLTAPLKKKLEKHAEKMFEFKSAVKKVEPSFNTFSLTDALGERDIKKLWALFREAKQHNIADEEIHGILFWMLKSIVLAGNMSTPEEAGMKPYPFTKAKNSLKNFSSLEYVEKLLCTFALLPQNARRKNIPLEIELERFILSL